MASHLAPERREENVRRVQPLKQCADLIPVARRHAVHAGNEDRKQQRALEGGRLNGLDRLEGLSDQRLVGDRPCVAGRRQKGEDGSETSPGSECEDGQRACAGQSASGTGEP